MTAINPDLSTSRELARRDRHYRFGKLIVKFHIPILIIGVLLAIPGYIGMKATHINYDILTYLPDSMETMEGQQILLDDFGKGAFSFIVIEDEDDQTVAEFKERIEGVDHVDTVLWVDALTSLGIPKEAIPEKYYKAFNNGTDTMLAVFFDTGTSADETLEAIEEIRSIANENVYVSGMSALVTDLKKIAEREEPVYVAMAVLGAVIALLVLTDSWLVPFIFLASIGVAILWNMGTNIIFGEISYITKALAAVLQLAVTMDYSIFLWHAFVERRDEHPSDSKEAMARAIGDSLTALVSSMLTASAGFLALCFMTYTLGLDLGLVMAKGCVLGLVGSMTTLPALILVFEKPLMKLRHKPLMPNVDKLGTFVAKHFAAFLVAFLVILAPAVWGFAHKPVYYDFTKVLTGGDMSSISEEDMKFHFANEKLIENFDVATTEMILCDSEMSHVDAKEMLTRLGDVDGVKYALGYDSLIGGAIPSQALPGKLTSALKAGGHQLILINSEYRVSTDEANNQIDAINEIIKEYDSDAMLIGESPATKDLIDTTDRDFHIVDWIAIAAIALILLVVFRSLSLPIILVLVIEFAIMINLGLPFYTNTEMVFIAPICISTIQLGSTVNYAILTTTRYRKERHDGLDKYAAAATAFSKTLPAVVTSAVSFFAATFTVALYSNVSIISSLTTLMARGAIISMFSVLFILPAFFVLFDSIIVRTSRDFLAAPEQTITIEAEGLPEVADAHEGELEVHYVD